MANKKFEIINGPSKLGIEHSLFDEPVGVASSKVAIFKVSGKMEHCRFLLHDFHVHVVITGVLVQDTDSFVLFGRTDRVSAGTEDCHPTGLLQIVYSTKTRVGYLEEIRQYPEAFFPPIQ